jgi:hypothetical protein
MYSLSISFGPTGTVWAYLFKEETNAAKTYNAWVSYKVNGEERGALLGSDDFGQSYAIPMDEIRGVMIEDLDQIEEARIQRSLADERCKAKFMVRAKTDPVIRQAMGVGSPGIVSPFPR